MYMKKASCVLVVNKKDKTFLSVSLKKDHEDMNLPGGRVEKDETYIQAGIRETKEETGITVWNLKELHCDVDSGWTVVTFYTHNYLGNIYTRENHVVKWLPLEYLKKSKLWPEYNTEVYDKYIDVMNGVEGNM